MQNYFECMNKSGRIVLYIDGVSRMLERIKEKVKEKKVLLSSVLIVIGVLASVYCTLIFSTIPVLAKWRTIYIETAMTTKNHQWMATCFIPHWIIDEVMANYYARLEEQKELESAWKPETELIDYGADFYKKYWELDNESARAYIDSLLGEDKSDYSNIVFEDFEKEHNIMTISGDPVVALDTKNNVLVIEVSDINYKGKLAIVKDSSQVDLVKSQNLGRHGELVEEYGKRCDAVLAVNGSRFSDVGGHGNGAIVKGAMVIDGQEYGDPMGDYWRFYGLKNDNSFCITNYSVEKEKEFRWAIECFPALVVDGNCVIDETMGMGIQPRAAVGQTQDGDFLILIVDGRQVGYSIGCTVKDCADLLMKYGAAQAACLDGGSSAVMWYKGEQITRSSSVAGNGRYIPDAIVVNKSENIK